MPTSSADENESTCKMGKRTQDTTVNARDLRAPYIDQYMNKRARELQRSERKNKLREMGNKHAKDCLAKNITKINTWIQKASRQGKREVKFNVVPQSRLKYTLKILPGIVAVSFAMSAILTLSFLLVGEVRGLDMQHSIHLFFASIFIWIFAMLWCHKNKHRVWGIDDLEIINHYKSRGYQIGFSGTEILIRWVTNEDIDMLNSFTDPSQIEAYKSGVPAEDILA